ncbi:unnamed protein product [Arctogadus glacialis]
MFPKPRAAGRSSTAEGQSHGWLFPSSAPTTQSQAQLALLPVTPYHPVQSQLALLPVTPYHPVQSQLALLPVSLPPSPRPS